MIASAQTSNSKLAQINNKLTVQSQNFAHDSSAIRSLDWNRRKSLVIEIVQNQYHNIVFLYKNIKMLFLYIR